MNDTNPSNSESDSTVPRDGNRRSSFGWNHSDRWFLIAISGCLLVLAGRHVFLIAKARDETIEIQRPAEDAYVFTIDINKATWVEWMQLDGIGETTARKIVDNREQHGPFDSIDDVTRVSGIGEKTLEKMRPHLGCENCD